MWRLFMLCSELAVDYIATFLPIATFVLGVAVTIVAWQQWRVARNKLRLDLFDRRYKVYDATRRFVRDSVQDFAHIDQHLIVFNDETSNAEFLFDADVVNYLEQIRQRAQDRDAVWLSDPDRITAMTKTFVPYLGFSNVKI
jgi:hypothetical protein